MERYFANTTLYEAHELDLLVMSDILHHREQKLASRLPETAATRHAEAAQWLAQCVALMGKLFNSRHMQERNLLDQDASASRPTDMTISGPSGAHAANPTKVGSWGSITSPLK